MEITIKNVDSKVVVYLNGRIDTATAEQFREALIPLIQGDAMDIEIDCSELSYTSSQGLRIFLLLQKSVTARKASLTLTRMNPQVKEVFDITGFSNIIRII